MEKEPLIKVSVVSKGEKIGLTNYSDLIVFDKDKTVVAIRIGGYPETVQAMSDILISGCDLELQGVRETIKVNTKGPKTYERKLSHDGVYAEGMHYLKDDVPNTIMFGDDESDGTKVAVKKNLYFFCKSSDELYEELDRKLSVPLIPEFKDYFISELITRKLLQQLTVYSLGLKFEAWHMKISEDETEVAKVLEDGLKSGVITIPGTKSGNLAVFNNIKTFRQYLDEFGSVVAERIKN